MSVGGYGTAPTLGPAQAVNCPTAETVTGVLVDAAERLSQIERNLTAIRERIQSTPDKAEPIRSQPVGLMGAATEIRGLSARIMDRCAELDRLL